MKIYLPGFTDADVHGGSLRNSVATLDEGCLGERPRLADALADFGRELARQLREESPYKDYAVGVNLTCIEFSVMLGERPRARPVPLRVVR